MKKVLNVIYKSLISLGVVVIVFALLGFAVKGEVGNPLYFQTELDTKLGGPFESSGSNSRYALTKSIVDHGTLFLNDELARFASPDLVVFNDKYTTLFTPGISFAAIPFYYIGKIIGLPQLITFLSGSIYAAINIFLIYLISRKFNVGKFFSLVSGLIFVFATSALSYSNTMTQHHLSVLLILLSILAAFGKKNFLNNLLLGIFISAGVLVDIPNVFMMAPIGLYAFFKHFSVSSEEKITKLKVNPFFVAIIVGLIPLACFFAWYNYQTLGSYTKLAQSVGRTDFFATEDIKEINRKQVVDPNKSTPLLPFETRLQLNGFYILLFSNERGIFYYNPIVIFGIIGLILAFKYKQSLTLRDRNNIDLAVMISSVVLVNVLLYSMFGDPWGGWSFGPRYMIPTLALLSTAIGLSLSKFGKNPIFAALFLLVLVYSAGVNVLGATTTNLVPPKVEAQNLATPIPYTYQYNFQLAQIGKSSSLIYNLYLNNLISVSTYIYLYAIAVVVFISSLFGAGLLSKERRVNV